MFGLNKKKAVTDQGKIENILTRGVENIFPNKEFVREKISKENIRIYENLKELKKK